MREIDLIPASYRQDRARKLWVKLLAAGVIGIVAITLGARLSLDAMVDRLDARAASLQAQQTISSQERDRLGALTAERDNFQSQLYLLQGLRSGTAATKLFKAFDEVLDGDELWFRNWQFRRAGVTNSAGEPVETGYFIVVADPESKVDAWQVETHMTIAGQALDHSTLSEFVKRLLGRPEIESVRIRRTEQREFGARSIVDFDLAVVINRRVID